MRFTGSVGAIVVLTWATLSILRGDGQLPSDFETCASEIDDLQGNADEAHSAAEEAASAKDELEDAASAARSRCSSYGESNYLCESARRLARDAKNEFESAADTFLSAYGELTSSIRSVQLACGVRTPIAGIPDHKQGLCRAVRNLGNVFSGSLTPAMREQFCKGLTAAECSTCLSR